MGLPVSTSWFTSTLAVHGAINTILGAIKQFGPRLTVRELVFAGARMERFAFAGAFFASGLAGAMIGSAAVAIGRTLAGGTSLSDVLITLHATYQSNDLAVKRVLINHPEIYQDGHPAKSFFYAKRLH